MNTTEHLLTILAEEGAEITHRACKALRFGLTDIGPKESETNRRAIEREVADLLAVFDMLGFEIRAEDVVAKREKVKKFMKYSREVGTLKGD